MVLESPAEILAAKRREKSRKNKEKLVACSLERRAQGRGAKDEEPRRGAMRCENLIVNGWRVTGDE